MYYVKIIALLSQLFFRWKTLLWTVCYPLQNKKEKKEKQGLQMLLGLDGKDAMGK